MKIHGWSRDGMGGSKIVTVGADSHFTLGIFGDIFRANTLGRQPITFNAWI